MLWGCRGGRPVARGGFRGNAFRNTCRPPKQSHRSSWYYSEGTAPCGLNRLQAGPILDALPGSCRTRSADFGSAIVVAEDGTPSVNAEIAVDSVHSGNDQRDALIKSADFFEADKYPVAAFASTGVESDGGNYVLNGQFTIKGVTKPVSLDLEFCGVSPGMGQGGVAGFEASVALNRKDFGIDIDPPLDSGGAMVGDKGQHHARHRGRRAGVGPQRANTKPGTPDE
jgi:polyisoprenoid-binding protein YceI